MPPYSTLADYDELQQPTYDGILAASAAIDARTSQHAPLLAIQTTYRTTLRSSFVSLPRPVTPTTVAVIEERVDIAEMTAAAALAVDGVRLAVDARTLSVGGQERRVTNAMTYRWYSNRLWEFVDYYGSNGYGFGYEDAVWIDGVMGWGRRVPVHGTGYAESLAADAETIAFTGTTAPSVGTALQWDDEICAVRAVAGDPGAFTLNLDRGLDGTEIADHAASTTLVRLTVPANLRAACVILAKRYSSISNRPGSGGAFSPDIGQEALVWANVDPLIAEFWRPHEA